MVLVVNVFVWTAWCAAGCGSQDTKHQATVEPPKRVAPSGGDDETAMARQQSAEPTVPAAGQSRRFRFIYGADISDLPTGAKARVWLPMAVDNHHQTVQRIKIDVPAKYREMREESFGNHLLYFEATADESGTIPLEIHYVVERREVVPHVSETSHRSERPQFLAASSLVPIDASLLKRLHGGEKPAGHAATVARILYDTVDLHMRYDKPDGKPWGRGDAAWACDSGYGNCSDFHSLFISICRSVGIPAKFEIGFPIPIKRGSGPVAGYHCWAKFVDRDRWLAVDISEADKHPEMKDYYFGRLTADRVLFSSGRDLKLQPPQQAGPVNFLVYPYVEVDGKRHTSLVKRFRYEDLPEATTAD